MKAKKSFIIGTVAAAVLFLVSCVMIAVSAVKVQENMELGIDLSGCNVTKVYTDNETIRVFGSQDGQVFATDLEGNLLWDAGSLYVSPVYELAVAEEDVFVVYANGRVVCFSAADAAVAEGGLSLEEQCTVYSVGTAFNTDGNVKNTQLIVVPEEGCFYLRGVFNDVSQINRIYRFDYNSAEPERLVGTSNAVGGMVYSDGTLYYAARSTVYSVAGGTVSTLQNVNETVVALSLYADSVAVITAQSNLFVMPADGSGTFEKTALSVTLNSDYVFSTGENFVGKINNGGVAMISAESRAVTLTMRASDSMELIMWTDESFVLYDGSDVNNPSITCFSSDLARSRELFSVLLYVFIALAAVFLIAGLVFGFGIREGAREAMKNKAHAAVRELWHHKFIYLSLIVPFVLLIIFYYIPIVLGFGLSFFEYVPGVRLVFVGLDNFVSVVLNSQFWQSALTMLIFLVADLLKAVIPPLIVAEAIFAVKFKRFSLVVRILLFLPGILPGVATTLVWSEGIFGATSNSLINAFVNIFVPGFAKNWINSASNATAIGSLIAFGFPWVGSYLIFYGAVSGINTSVFEAAKLDGCGWWRRMVTMDVPLIFPQIKYIVITSFIASVQNYTTIYVLYGVNGQIKTPALLVYREIINANYGVASVMGLLIFAFLSICTAMNFKIQMKQAEEV